MESRLSERANDVRRLARCYSGEAEVYKRLWAPVLYPFGLRLVRALPMGQARRVLEIGTGIGLLLPEIQKAAPASVVVGVDIAEGMLKLAPRSCLPAVMDASQLALQSDQFDAALLPFVLFHLPQPAEALRGWGACFAEEVLSAPLRGATGRSFRRKRFGARSWTVKGLRRLIRIENSCCMS